MRIAVVALLFAAATAHAESTPWKESSDSAVRLVTEVVALGAGETTFAGGLEVRLAPGWHIYWKHPGDSGFPPTIHVPPRSDVQSVTVAWPRPRRFQVKGGLTVHGYDDGVLYPLTFHMRGPAVLGRASDVRVILDYLVCAEECLPYKYSVSLELPTRERRVIDTELQQRIVAASALVPGPLWPDTLVRGQIVKRGQHFELETRLETREAQQSPAIFFDAHPAVVFGGSESVLENAGKHVVFRTKLSPTRPDFAAEPLRVSVTFTNVLRGGAPAYAEHTLVAELAAPPSARTLTGALWFMLVLALAGGAMLNLTPCVLPVLSLKLFGLMSRPGEARAGSLWSVAGILVSFLLLAGFVLSLRAAGESVGWGVQFQQPAFVAFLAVVVTLFALNLWGVFEVPLPGFLARLGKPSGMSASNERHGDALTHFAAGLFATLLATPCSAPFLGTAVAFALAEPPLVVLLVFVAIGFGMSVPYFLIAVRPSFVRLLPRPGEWTVRLERVLGFGLAATAVWLGYVLSGQLSREDRAIVELLLVAIALSAWASETYKARRLARSLAIAATLLFSGLAILHAQRGVARGEGELPWEVFDQARFEKLRSEGRPVFVDVTADWCVTCKVNDRLVLSSPAVAAALAERHAVLLKADWTNRDETIAAFLHDNGKSGVPFYLFQPERGAATVLPELLSEGIVLDAVAKRADDP